MNQVTRVEQGTTESFKARFTTAEFERMIQADAFGDAKIELVDGELERSQQPKNHHAMRQTRLVMSMGGLVGVEWVRGEAGVDLGGDSILACDAALLRVPIHDNRWMVPGDLLLVVEVA